MEHRAQKMKTVKNKSRSVFGCFRFHVPGSRGVSLYLTIVLLSLMLTSLLTLSAILTSQMKIVFNLGNSVTAFIAADAGVERALYEARRATSTPSFSHVFSNGARYDVTVTSNGETVIKSVGSYRGTERAIEARY